MLSPSSNLLFINISYISLINITLFSIRYKIYLCLLDCTWLGISKWINPKCKNKGIYLTKLKVILLNLCKIWLILLILLLILLYLFFRWRKHFYWIIKQFSHYLIYFERKVILDLREFQGYNLQMNFGVVYDSSKDICCAFVAGLWFIVGMFVTININIIYKDKWQTVMHIHSIFWSWVIVICYFEVGWLLFVIVSLNVEYI